MGRYPIFNGLFFAAAEQGNTMGAQAAMPAVPIAVFKKLRREILLGHTGFTWLNFICQAPFN
jgi:hypothetical protein